MSARGGRWISRRLVSIHSREDPRGIPRFDSPGFHSGRSGQVLALAMQSAGARDDAMV
jgi:hypothetical protein